ncbi:hypothetical protein [Pseudescherichia sp.]|uniref:hypothetical protein n=1 Tax=Pseudescherichia sp. TaxID=2055881 RepID=UPI0028B030CC|nr:hypothetical protein [Pseudescherichia sp.]
MKEQIFIGENITEVIPANTTLKIGNKETTVFEYSNLTDSDTSIQINTSKWETGTFSVVLNKSGEISISTTDIIDPLAVTDEFNHCKMMIKEIDQVIEDRTKNAVTTVTINNKTIVNESLDALYKVRSLYVKRANDILKKKNKKGGIFKSITVFRG